MKQRMYLASLPLLAVVLLLSACQPPTSPEGDRRPVRAVLNNPSALFLAQEASSRSLVRSLESNQLFELLPDGTIQAVPFYDQEGNLVEMSIFRIYQLGPDYIGLDVDGYSVTSVVLKLSTGKVYDVSGFSLAAACVQNDYIYARKYDTLYKIDFTNLVAVPITNPITDSLSAGAYFLYVTPSELVYLYDWGGGGAKVFYPDNRPPLSTGSYSFRCPAGAGSYHGSHTSSFLTAGGAIWDVCHQNNLKYYQQITIGETGLVREPSTSFDDGGDGDLLNVGWVNPSVHDPQRYLLCANGYYAIQVDNEELSVSFTSKPFPTLLKEYTSPGFRGYLSGTKVYVLDGGAIKYMDILSDTTFSTLVTPANLYSWKVLCEDTVVYTVYITATSIGTYRMRIGEEAQLISQSEMDIIDIIELSLP